MPFPPAIRLSTNGLTWGAPGAKLQVSPGGTVYAKLDSIANVNEVAWEVASTDGTSDPSAFAIAPSTGAIVGDKVQLIGDVAGTAGLLRATINAGVGPDGNVQLELTTATVKWWVPAANGLEVGCAGEGFESDPAYGTTKVVNAAIRGAGAGPSNAGPLVTTSDGSTVSLAPAITIPDGQTVTLTFRLKAKVASTATVVDLMLAGSIGLTAAAGVVGLTGLTEVESIASIAPWSEPNPAQVAMVVSGAADNGAGAVRLTVNATGGVVQTGNIVTVTGVSGTGGIAAAANGTWPVDVIDATHIDLRGSTFAGVYSSGGTAMPLGCFLFAPSGSDIVLQANGITAPAWRQSETVRKGDVRSNASGVWLCSQAGTTDGSGTGPSGSGAVTGVSDGGATWDRIGDGPGVPISWQIVDLHTYTL